LKIKNIFFLFIYLIIFLTCKKYDINEVSEHYKTNKDIKSLKILANTLKKGMIKSDVEKLFGEADYLYKINKNNYLYITHERTKRENSFYILTIKFNNKDKIIDYYLSIADK
jgi:hypothetical protein